MIRIVRSPSAAPQSLLDSEARELPSVGGLPGAAGPLVTRHVDGRARDVAGKPLQVYQPPRLVDGDSVKGYGNVRPYLYEMQHHKCCYCESMPEEKHHHVEHFRPKSCYWWLAWSWTNLTLSCNICNEHKLNYFPLNTSECLQPKENPPGVEQPLLIDPSDVQAPDPLEHIEFMPLGKFRWKPFPRKVSRLGQELIAAVLLDRTTLLDRYRLHAEQFEDALIRIRREISKPGSNDLLDVWENVCNRWMKAEYPYTALSRDILHHHFRKEIQENSLDLSVRYVIATTVT